MEEKHFEEWIVVKSDLHNKSTLRDIKEGDIYWCAVGENVGVEINGKSETFARPVVIMKKLSKFGFMGIPLTSQPHSGSWYVPFVLLKKCPLILRLGWTGIPEYRCYYNTCVYC
ncbi:hypothetical protein IJU85_01210 [Candidatus Saccharibacteria bacterium]|nr:hypothetical protein [Candidatus Saccharibacteria bacterium]